MNYEMCKYNMLALTLIHLDLASSIVFSLSRFHQYSAEYVCSLIIYTSDYMNKGVDKFRDRLDNDLIRLTCSSPIAFVTLAIAVHVVRGLIQNGLTKNR